MIHLVRSQNSLKNEHFLPRAYQEVRNVSFLENFAKVLKEWAIIQK